MIAVSKIKFPFNLGSIYLFIYLNLFLLIGINDIKIYQIPTTSYNKRIVESIIFKIVITAHSMIKVKHKRTIRIGFITEWEVVILIMTLLLFHNVNLKYKLV